MLTPPLTRAQALEYVGDLTQLAGLTHAKWFGGVQDGLEVITLHSEALEVEILPGGVATIKWFSRLLHLRCKRRGSVPIRGGDQNSGRLLLPLQGARARPRHDQPLELAHPRATRVALPSGDLGQ